MDLVLKMFSYPFMLRALVVGGLVSLCAALLGVNLVLKRYSMIGDGLSHVGFGALSVAMAMNVAPLKIAIPVVVLSAYFLLRISNNSKVNSDSAIAIISTTAVAVGVIIISLTTGMTNDVSNYMFGSVLSSGTEDVLLSVILSILVIFTYVVFYNRIFVVTFDEDFAKASGINVSFYNMLIAFLTAITIVLGMRMMGTLLISSLIVFPAITSMRICKRFLSLIIMSGIISILCFVFGLVASFSLSTPVGASVVIMNVMMFLIISLIGKIKNSC